MGKLIHKVLHASVGFVLCFTLFLTSVVFAETGIKTLEVTYHNIILMVDGKQITPKDEKGNIVEPFIIDGVTYVPIVNNDVLNKHIKWDEKANTIIIGETPPADKVITLLSSLKSLSRLHGIKEWKSGDTDNWDNKYTSGYSFVRNAFDNANLAYNLDKKYTKLTATITPSQSGDGVNKFEFYSVTDISTKKIYETVEIKQTTKPFTITVDLTGVDTLMITDLGSWTLGIAIVDAYLE
jgi:hypothetical protein